MPPLPASQPVDENDAPPAMPAPRGQVVAVSVGRPKAVLWRGEEVETGIFKAPVATRVPARRLGLEGDGQADLTAHGGVDKAVYAYDTSGINHWCKALGRSSIDPGEFGENLTLSGWPEDAVSIGDVLRIGSARFEVSQPRQPCFKLGLRFEDAGFPKRFLKAGRVGFYLRVLDEGDVGAGDDVQCEHRDPAGFRVRDVVALAFGFADGFSGDFAERFPEAASSPLANAELYERLLSRPALADAWRPMLEDRMRRIASPGKTASR